VLEYEYDSRPLIELPDDAGAVRSVRELLDRYLDARGVDACARIA